jgi:hypothetical protein
VIRAPRSKAIVGALLAALFLASIALAGNSLTGPATKSGRPVAHPAAAKAVAKKSFTGPKVGRSYKNVISRPARTLAQAHGAMQPLHVAAENPSLIGGKVLPTFVDPVVQGWLPKSQMPGPMLNFDGIPFPGVNCNCAPPDTNGEVGLDQYVQIVNQGFQVFDKSTGNSIFGPVDIGSLWTDFGGPCEFAGRGDPVVLYDQLANRWVITQFAVTTTVTDECIAVSTSSDATGTYALYGFHLGEDFFDYPKFGVWPDAYYMGMNVFNASGTAFLGPQPFAFDRAAMLAGDPATFVTFRDPSFFNPSSDQFMPADLDGLVGPPADSPNPFVSTGVNPTWPLYRFHVDFAVPANSTFTLGGTLTPAPFTVLFSLVPQLGGDGLDSLADRGMFRSAYRNFGDHEALVGNMTVASGGVAGVRWFEVNNVTSGSPSFVQQSTYQPDDTWRWMGSAAMDHSGDLAVGFSASSATINPQIRYAGRLAGDPPNTLAQGEATLFNGTGSQLDTFSRWGDYSDMTVDPVDDCTFWYTQEYYETTSSFNWRTRIGNFKFPTCTALPTGTLEGTVTDSSNGNPIAGADINVSPLGASTTSGPDGHYSILLPVGTYDVTASAFGYVTQTANGVAITDGGTTTRDFPLDPAPSHTVSGHVRDSDLNPLANATVTILGTPIPPATTDANGFYSFASVPEGEYDVRAEAGRCNDPQTQHLVVDGDETLDFALPQRSDSFGYFCVIQDINYIEANTVLPLTGDDASIPVSLPFPFTFYGQTYNTAHVATNGFLNFLAPNATFSNSGIPSTFAPNGAIYPFWDDLFVDASASVRTQLLGVAPNRQFVIEWRNVHFFADATRRVDFEVVLNENGRILTQYRNIAADSREKGNSATVGIENHTGTVALQYSFNQAAIADPTFAVLYRLPPSGFVEGHVTDANDNAGIGGAAVKAIQNGNVVQQTSTDASGFYRMQLRIGDYTIEASKTNYETVSADVTITEDQTTTQDFSLRTPRGEVSPTSLEFIVPANQTRTKTLTLSNTGSLTMTWDVQESGGGPAAPSRVGLQKNESYDPNSATTEGLYVGKQPAGPSPDGPGDILRQWPPTGLSLAWGVGYDGHVWLSDIPTNNRNHEFLVDGTPTGTSFAAPWAGAWPGDMALMGTEMCQVNVGGDNGIYCWDRGSGAVTRSITGAFPWTTISQRGLAYRPDDDSFYIGGWNQGILYHVAGFSHPTPGQVLNQCNAPDFNISGLAWNPAVGQVWEATNSVTDTIYRVDPTTCAMVSTLPHPGHDSFDGAGLEMDEGGNLWMIRQSPNTVFLVDSGVPAFGDVPWLSENPTSGTINPGASQNVAVRVDTTGMSPGVYQATLTFRTNSGRQPNLSVPVRLIVPAYQQAFNSGGGAYTSVSGEPWSADRAYTPANGSGYVQSPPRTASTHSPIGGTLDDPLYQDARISAMTYRFTGLPPGVYQVELNFAEIQNKNPGLRVFDVTVNGMPYVTGLDISSLVGKNYALDRSQFWTPVGGEINVQFITRRSFGEPIVNAIRVTHRPDR